MKILAKYEKIKNHDWECISKVSMILFNPYQQHLGQLSVWT